MRIIQTLSDQTFNRAPRIRPPLPAGEIEIPSPPMMPQPPSTSWWAILLPVLGIGLFIGISAASGGNSAFMLGSGAMMLVSVGVSVTNYLQQKKKFETDREARSSTYAQALTKAKTQLETARQEQREALLRTNPDSLGCLMRAINLDASLWERRPQDADFLALRMGCGDLPTSMRLKLHKPPVVMPPDQDPKLHQQAVSLGDIYSTVPDVPITTSLQEVGVLGVAGPPPSQHGLLRGILASLVTHHSPDEVKLVVFLPQAQADDWAWLRWLPHVHTQIGGLSRWLATTQEDAKRLAGMLGQEWNRRKLQIDISRSQDDLPLPRYVLLVADQNVLQQPAISQVLAEGKKFGAYIIVLGPDRPHLPKQCGAVVEVYPGEPAQYTLIGESTQAISFEADKTDSKHLEETSRTLAPIRPAKEVAADSLPDSVRTLELHGAQRVEELPLWDNWQNNKIYEKVEAPIGVRAGGHPMLINLWENIHGPHGLLAGATRSGKSELLKTLVSSLAIQYHPHDLNFVLIDFKGGGLNRDIEDLPHVVGTATNLEDGLPERALEAIKAELIRREALLKGRHIKDYQKDYHAGKVKHPLPRMIVIIDEFAELAAEQPEMLNNLVSAARVGGSLGVHLILATQKPAGVVKGQIWSNSRFRICLRVETAEDSNDMLRRPDASALDRPGRGYFQVGDNEVYELIQVARSEATYVTGEAVVSDQTIIAKVRFDGRRELLWPPPDTQASTIIHTQSTTDLQAIVEYVNQVAESHGIAPLPGPWLPMLPKQVDLGELRSQHTDGGWDGKTWKPSTRWLRPLVGLLDDTAHQEQPPFFVDLGKRGHLYLCGSTGSGKTTFLRTLVASLIQDHSPEDVNLYLLDYGGRGMDIFEDLPHVGAVLHPGDEEIVERLFRWLLEEMERRNDLMGDASNFVAYRKRKGAEKLPALVVVIDSYATLTETFEDTREYIQKLARGGHSVGIHLVVATDRVGALSTRSTTNFSLRMCFFLTERSDYSMVVGKSPHFILRQVPGRCILKEEALLECQIGSLEADRGVSGGPQALSSMVTKMTQTWAGIRAHPMRELPKRVALAEVLKEWATPEDVGQKDTLVTPVGLDALRLEPAALDLVHTGPHFLVAGQSQSGKTAALQTILTSLASNYPPERVQFWLVDSFQPGLDALRELPHTRAYAGTEEEHLRLVTELCDLLRERGSSVKDGGSTRIILAMDDYDFFEDKSIKDQLYSWARRARPIGFHILLAGAASELRGGFDDLRRQVLTSRCGLLLTNAAEDGQIFNARLPISSEPFPPGRGYLIRRGKPGLVQWAMPLKEFSKPLTKRRSGKKNG